MSQTKPMTALRRPMPGMPATAPARSAPSAEPAGAPVATKTATTRRPAAPRRPADASSRAHQLSSASASRRASADYSSTRLANFRLPVDLHDHYRQLVREVEKDHPRLRRPSLTEVIIALLEEGPQTAAEAAELLRRRRAAENSQEVSS